MNTSTKFFVGFLAGALTGASIALLFAPEKGTETRKIIRNRMDKCGERGKEMMEKYKAKKKSEE